MACGVRLPIIAVMFTLFMSPVIYFLHRFDVGVHDVERECCSRSKLPEQHRATRKPCRELFYEFLKPSTRLLERGDDPAEAR